MSKRAEERALEFYPMKDYNTVRALPYFVGHPIIVTNYSEV